MELIERAFALTALPFSDRKTAMAESKEFHQNRSHNSEATVFHYRKILHVQMRLWHAPPASRSNPRVLFEINDIWTK